MVATIAESRLPGLNGNAPTRASACWTVGPAPLSCQLSSEPTTVPRPAACSVRTGSESGSATPKAASAGPAALMRRPFDPPTVTNPAMSWEAPDPTGPRHDRLVSREVAFATTTSGTTLSEPVPAWRRTRRTGVGVAAASEIVSLAACVVPEPVVETLPGCVCHVSPPSADASIRAVKSAVVRWVQLTDKSVPAPWGEDEVARLAPLSAARGSVPRTYSAKFE